MAQGNTTDTPRVLVVEDDPVSATLIQKLFATQGLTIDHAPDGAIALKLHRQNPYRIIVSDWMMPEMDGVTLCREFRQLGGPYVYFILCSAKHQREDRMEAYEAGVDDFLTKPLDRHEMQARLKVARRILATEDALQSQYGALEENAVELEAANVRLEKVSDRFRGLFHGLPLACFTFDRQGRIQEWNRTCEDVFGIPETQAVGQFVWSLLDSETQEFWNPKGIEETFNGTAPNNFDWDYFLGRRKRILACSIITLPGEPQQAICASLDITSRKLAEERIEEQMIEINRYATQMADQKVELERINNRLNHLAITDGLTGLWNHRRFNELLEEGVDEYARTLEPFSLVLLDIDNFKRINDEFGHQVGDDVLKQFADCLRQQSRSYELPARYGGEEFAIIFRNCAEDEAMRAAERFRKVIEKQTWKPKAITASFGISTCSVQGTSSKLLVRQADYALYTAKQRGRNCSVHFKSLSGNEGSLIPQLS